MKVFNFSKQKKIIEASAGMELCGPKRILLMLNDGKNVMQVEISIDEVKMINSYMAKHLKKGVDEEDEELDDKPTLKIDLSGPDGNAFFILAKVKGLLEKEAYSEYREKATSGDYDHLLAVTREYVNLEEL